MTTTVQIRFEGLPVPFTASSFNTPEHPTDFEPLPADATLHVLRKRGLFINRKSDRRLQELSVEQARNWGKDDENDTELIFAQAKTPDARYCVRLVPNVEKFYKRKHSNRFWALQRLMRDALFHSAHLADCERWIVPVHYGMWFMDTGDWAGKVFLSITQWCGISWRELSHTKLNTEANRDSTWEDGLRHAIIDIEAPDLSREDLLNGKARCYLVGFSEAEAGHSCRRRVPVLPLGSHLSPQEVGCEEIADVLLLMKFTKKAKTRVSAAKALEWHTYSRLYPDQDNTDVTIAQRTRLYPDAPPLYPYLTVSFDGEGEYAKAIIRRIDSDEAEPTLDPVDPDDETSQIGACLFGGEIDPIIFYTRPD
ncbi:hypothetical protein C8R47DRAFT_1072638 [Mycena vitilis]|nr:hypothetical protein C8R47DRAFT_1072638 [Mycena vitilis]